MNKQNNIYMMQRMNKSHFEQYNSKIIKLIRQKIYPFKHTNRSLPRLKRLPKNDPSLKQNKKYVEIEIKEQQNYNCFSQQTDLEQQLRINATQDRNNSPRERAKNQITAISFSLHNPLGLKEKQMSREQFENDGKNESYQQSKQKMLLKEYDNNINYLNLFKNQINNKKKEYIQQHKLTELARKPYEEKGHFQYLINKFTSEGEKRKKNNPYEEISPNHLSEYLELLSPNNKTFDTRFDTGEFQYFRTTCRYPEKQFKPSNYKKRNYVVELTDGSAEGYSAKLRLKANHKKMIERI